METFKPGPMGTYALLAQDQIRLEAAPTLASMPPILLHIGFSNLTHPMALIFGITMLAGIEE
jgi:hypothetical protein